MKHNWLIIYDIADPSRLRKVMKKTEQYGDRVQKSVFEAIAEEKTIMQLKKEIEKIIDSDDDFVVYFKLCDSDWQKQEKYGPGADEKREERSYEIL